jgi:regulator of protease activity HflC (stomatin/prohibitin superfamily)
METAFAWIGQIFDALLQFVPRIIIIRATHGGVKWKRGSRVKAMHPGLHIYWPLATDIEVIVTARQTHNVPSQVLTTQDNKKVVVGTVVVYKIRDVVQAIGKENWDVDTTLSDITQAAVVEVIAKHTLDELTHMIADGRMSDMLTAAVRKELRRFGVYVSRCKLCDFADCKVYKLVTGADATRGAATAQAYC